MRLLWIEDDMVPIGNYRVQLLNAGHEVEVVREGVATAHEKLKASLADRRTGYDCVIIDLSLPHEQVPTVLLKAYQPLAPIGSFSMNQGQAIGQWLWEGEGLRNRVGRPWHFYLTQVPDQYRHHPAVDKQEFRSITGKVQSQFVVSKWSVRNLETRLRELQRAWIESFGSASPTTETAP